MVTKVSLDLDDASIINNRLDLLRELKESFPDFKVSLFFIPYHFTAESSMQRIYRDRFKQELVDCLDWIELIPHGLTHIPRELENCDREAARLVLNSVEEVMEKEGLPYVKGFKAPYWLWTKDFTDELDSRGWWGAVDRNQPNMVRPQKTYLYTHSLEEPFWEADGHVKLHGHIDGQSANDLEACFLNIMKLDPETKFEFISQHIQ